jgi:urease accessory protein
VVQKPLYPEGEAICDTIVVHPPGGIAGGDELEIAIDVRAGARLVGTTPGATRWYKANGREARQRVRLDVAAGGCIEWLPQESILFDATRARMETEIALAAGARYLGWEVTAFGRVASGERFAAGALRQATAIRIGGKLVWNERAMLEAGDRLFASRLGLDGCSVTGTLLAAGAEVPGDVRDRCRELAAGISADDRAGVSSLGDVFVARYRGGSTERCRTFFVALWTVLRPAMLGREARPPRI